MLFVNLFLIATSADRVITGDESPVSGWSWYQGRCTAEAPLPDGKVVDPEGNSLPTDRTWGKEWIRPRDITPTGDQAAAFEQSKLSQGAQREDFCKQLCEDMTSDVTNQNTCYAYEMRSGECFLITSDRVSWGGADGDSNAMCFRNNRLVAGWQSFNKECTIRGRTLLGEAQGIKSILECKKLCNARSDCHGFTSQGNINGNGLSGLNAPEDGPWNHFDSPQRDNRQNMLNPTNKFVCALITPAHDVVDKGITYRVSGNGMIAGNGSRCFLRKRGCADYPGFAFRFRFSETEVGSLFNIDSACECREQCKQQFPTAIAFTWWNHRSEFKSFFGRQELDGKNCQCWDKTVEAPVTQLGLRGPTSLGGGLGLESRMNAWSGLIIGSAPAGETRPVVAPAPPAPVASPCSPSAPAPVSGFAGYRKLAGKGWCVQPDSSGGEGKIANYMRIGGGTGPSALSYADCAAQCDSEPLCHSFTMDCDGDCATSSTDASAQIGNSHCEFYGTVAPLTSNFWMPGTSSDMSSTPDQTADAYQPAGTSEWRCWVKDSTAVASPPASGPVVTCGAGTELVGTECVPVVASPTAPPTWPGNCQGEQGGVEQGVVLQIIHKQGKSDEECASYCNANIYCKVWMRTSKQDCYLYREGVPQQQYTSPSWHNAQRRGWKCPGADEPVPVGGAGCDGMTGSPDWLSGVAVRRGVHTVEDCQWTCRMRFDCKYWWRQKAGSNCPGCCWTASGASFQNNRRTQVAQDMHIYGWKCQSGPPTPWSATPPAGRRLEDLAELEAPLASDELEAPTDIADPIVWDF